MSIAIVFLAISLLYLYPFRLAVNGNSHKGLVSPSYFGGNRRLGNTKIKCTELFMKMKATISRKLKTKERFAPYD